MKHRRQSHGRTYRLTPEAKASQHPRCARSVGGGSKRILVVRELPLAGSSSTTQTIVPNLSKNCLMVHGVALVGIDSCHDACHDSAQRACRGLDSLFCIFSVMLYPGSCWWKTDVGVRITVRPSFVQANTNGKHERQTLEVNARRVLPTFFVVATPLAQVQHLSCSCSTCAVSASPLANPLANPFAILFALLFRSRSLRRISTSWQDSYRVCSALLPPSALHLPSLLYRILLSLQTRNCCCGHVAPSFECDSCP